MMVLTHLVRRIELHIPKMALYMDLLMNLDIFCPMSYNKHYCVPYNLSGIFTGRDDIIQQLREGCLPPKPQDRVMTQKRFVLYGLGGSGKTQACLKFAHDYRDK